MKGSHKPLCRPRLALFWRLPKDTRLCDDTTSKPYKKAYTFVYFLFHRYTVSQTLPRILQVFY